MARDKDAKEYGNKTIPVLLGIMITGTIFLGGFGIYTMFAEEKEQQRIEETNVEKKEDNMLELVKEKKLVRNVDKVRGFEMYEDVEDDTKENFLIREWEEGTKDPTFLPYKLMIINEKNALVVDYVKVTVNFEENLEKPNYSYYRYNGKIYNPILHLPMGFDMEEYEDED